MLNIEVGVNLLTSLVRVNCKINQYISIEHLGKCKFKIPACIRLL